MAVLLILAMLVVRLWLAEPVVQAAMLVAAVGFHTLFAIS
jgi:uncharacterized membrane protein YgaE (UPF0421/DUF939 family)